MMYRNSRRNRSQRQNPGKRILNNSIQKSNRNRNRRPSTLVFSNSRLGVPTLEKKSCSDPELGGRSTIVGHFGGLPPGLTVDELSLYRRRRPPSHLRPQDNLHPEEGSLKAIKSEYRRRYITPPFLLAEIDHDVEDDHLAEILGTSEGSLVTAVAADRDGEHQVLVKKDRRRRRPEDELRLEGEVFFRPEYYEAYVDFPRQRPKIVRPRTHINSENHKEIPMDLITEKNAQYVFFDGARRPELARRPTILHNEGEMLVKESEIRSKYLPHEGAKKADLARRNTSLRMEGDMETKTEQKDKYITFSPGRRAELVKRRTQLTLEGEMDTLTESNDKYVYIASPKRVPFKKRPTNLRLEGEMEKVSENADKYVEFHEGRRSELMRRSTNLNLEGDLEHAPEYRDNYVDFPRERPVMRRPSTHLKPEGELHTTTEKSSQYIDYVSAGRRPPIARRKTTLSLEGEIESNPEYRESFVDFPRERPTISRRRTNLNLEGEMESKPEYKESFIDFPRERPRLRRPESSLKLQGVIETVTEKEAQYVPFLSSDTTAVVKRPPVNLRLEGEMHTTPEYRESYVDFPRERPVTKKPSGQLQSDSNASVLLASDPYKRPRGPGRPPESNFRSDGRIDSDPEYRSSYVDIVPRDKPTTRRLCQRQTGGSKKADSRMTRSHSEKRYRNLSDIEDGYRRTYIDYTGRDRTPSRRRKPDNINFSGGTSLVAALSSPRVNRRVSASTRIVPPAGHHIAQEIGGAGRSRSKTVTFEIGDQRPRTCPWNDARVTRKQDTSNDSEDSFPVETGSDEPSFRLQVTNVDEVSAENDDFVRRRKRGRRRRASRSSPPIPILSRSIVSSRAPSPEGAIQFKVPVPVAYPLRQMEHNNNPAFVVLDDLNNNSHFPHATTGIQRTNFLDIPGKEQPHRGGSQRVNWMPPWSDAPTSI